MDIVDEIVGFDVCVRLKQGGYPQSQSLMYWVKDRIGVCLYERTTDLHIWQKVSRPTITCGPGDILCAAPSAAEIWNKMPAVIKRNGKNLVLTVTYNLRSNVIAGYVPVNMIMLSGDEILGAGPKLSEALAELWLACQERRKKG